jgi:hypothetical protein
VHTVIPELYIEMISIICGSTEGNFKIPSIFKGRRVNAYAYSDKCLEEKEAQSLRFVKKNTGFQFSKLY